ncbi:MAG: hypothetical protein QOD10_2411 [Mycobacterium sp.]|jgi:hypothetical protein|nr:hypothetical protein [Mycobacterium sp.]
MESRGSDCPMPPTPPQPLYLLADSQLLFWKRQDRLLLATALDGLARDTPVSAAYIGASNGDRPEFYGSSRRRWMRSESPTVA